MTDSRSRGLYQLQGIFMLFLLPLYFTLAYHFAVINFDKFSYTTMNFQLYLAASILSGALTFNSYQRLSQSMDPFRMPRILDVTSRQSIMLMIVMMVLVFATKDKGMSRIFMGSFILSSWFFFFGANVFLIKILPCRVFQGQNLRSSLLIGSSETCARVESWLMSQSRMGQSLVGLLSFDTDPAVPTQVPLLGTVNSLENVIAAKNVNQIILLTTNNSKEWVQQILQICRKNGCRLLVYNPWGEYFSQPLGVVQAGPHTFFALKSEPLENPLNRCLKRSLDICVSLIIVLTILPVLTLIVYLAQRLQAPGPLLFKQKRSGFNGSQFLIYKFRSMRVEKEGDEAIQATKNDKRVFWFGKIMRRLSLDEFPQFLNVLKGDMSLVGPRPHYIEHDKLFKQHVFDYRQRFFAKPGISGLAQIKGFRGEITDIDVLQARINYDLEYIDNWSFGLDVTIIIRTVWAMLFPPKSAY